MRKYIDKPIESESTEPWNPASILSTNPIPGFRTRWIRKDLLDKKLLEGWTPVETDSNTIAPMGTIIDGSQISQYVTKRNLILCKMSEGKAKSRDAYFNRLTDAAAQSTTEYYKEKFGSKEVYGEGLREDLNI